ncbi:hypothetical protein GGI42DRAFT_127525 [Trichoderma sp. SZMC 28013]
MACDGEADGATGPFISRCCDLYEYGALRLARQFPLPSWLHVLVPWRDEQARTESSTTFVPQAACVGGLPGVTVKHPRVYSKIARRPNGSVRSRLCRWFSTYCIQLVVWRATLWMDGSDGMPTAQTCLFGIICGRRAPCTLLVPVL